MPTIVHWRSSLQAYLVALMSHLDTRRTSLSKHSFLRKRQACPEQRVLQDSFDQLIPHHQSTAESIRPDYAKSGKASLSNKIAFLEYSQKVENLPTELGQSHSECVEDFMWCKNMPLAAILNGTSKIMQLGEGEGENNNPV